MHLNPLAPRGNCRALIYDDVKKFHEFRWGILAGSGCIFCLPMSADNYVNQGETIIKGNEGGEKRQGDCSRSQVGDSVMTVRSAGINLIREGEGAQYRCLNASLGRLARKLEDMEASGAGIYSKGM